MLNKQKAIFTASIMLLLLGGCNPGDTYSAEKKRGGKVTAVVVGSAEYPDPVLERVQELERKGIVEDVLVRESFPVQIEVTGPKAVIEELQSMHRKEPESPLY